MGVDSVDDVVLIGHRNSTTVAVSMLSQVSQGQELRWTDANWDSEREFADWDSGRKFNPIMVAMDRTATRGNILAVALFSDDKNPALPSLGKSRRKPGTLAFAKLLAKSNLRSFRPLIELNAV